MTDFPEAQYKCHTNINLGIMALSVIMKIVVFWHGYKIQYSREITALESAVAIFRVENSRSCIYIDRLHLRFEIPTAVNLNLISAG